MQSWALDFTLKTNQYDLPLYLDVVPNQYDQGMPIFLHVMFKDKESCQEGYEVEICFEIMFKVIENVRPSTIVINKHLPSLHVIKVAMNKNPHCWKDGVIGGEQIIAIILLCRFHALKAWIENLLPKVPHSCHHEIWHQLHILMYFDNESNFAEKVFQFYQYGGCGKCHIGE
jgi:hypothetical protein